MARTACGGATPSSSPVTSSDRAGDLRNVGRPGICAAPRRCARSRRGSGASATRARRPPPPGACCGSRSTSRPARSRPRSPACRVRLRCAPSAPRARIGLRLGSAGAEQRAEQREAAHQPRLQAAARCEGDDRAHRMRHDVRALDAGRAADAHQRPHEAVDRQRPLDAVRAPGARQVRAHRAKARQRRQQRRPDVGRPAQAVDHQHRVAARRRSRPRSARHTK